MIESRPRSKNDHVCGREALEQRQEFQCSYPVQGGCVRKWDEMETLLDHAIHTLGGDHLKNSESRILITEPPLNPVDNKKKMMEVQIILMIVTILSKNLRKKLMSFMKIIM